MNNNDSNNICIRSWGRRRNGGIRWRWDLRKYKIKLTTHLTHKWSTYTDTREFNSGKQYIYGDASQFLYVQRSSWWLSFWCFCWIFFFFTKAVFSTSSSRHRTRYSVLFFVLFIFILPPLLLTHSYIRDIEKVFKKPVFCIFLFSLLLFAAAADCSFQ